MDRDSFQHPGDTEAVSRQDALRTRRLLIAKLRQLVMARVIYPPFRKEVYVAIDELAKEIGVYDG